MKSMNRQETQGRFFLLSIPDLIRDPGKGKIPLNPPFPKGEMREGDWIPPASIGASAGMVISDIFKAIR
jgi:hypothetical protein